MASIWTAIAMVLLLVSMAGQLAALPPGQQPRRRALLVSLCCVGVFVLALSLYLVATALIARGR